MENSPPFRRKLEFRKLDGFSIAALDTGFRWRDGFFLRLSSRPSWSKDFRLSP
ncbi:MAG: hypothetical protein LBI87_09665 [Candidatus Accumulibacter sp.]|nr:hypothetical protein [Accumulibacter sp.]